MAPVSLDGIRRPRKVDSDRPPEDRSDPVTPRAPRSLVPAFCNSGPSPRNALCRIKRRERARGRVDANHRVTEQSATQQGSLPRLNWEASRRRSGVMSRTTGAPVDPSSPSIQINLAPPLLPIPPSSSSSRDLPPPLPTRPCGEPRLARPPLSLPAWHNQSSPHLRDRTCAILLP